MKQFLAVYCSIGLGIVLLVTFINPALFRKFNRGVVVLGVVLVILLWPYFLIIFALFRNVRK